MTQLSSVDGFLFSEGVRDDPHPSKSVQESWFEFLDRVRQPWFGRLRAWWELAYSQYPVGLDKTEVGGRFRSRDEAEHLGAAWEIYQHELWRRLEWTLTPHPSTPDGKRRDFLVEHPDREAFYLECTVDLVDEEQRGAERRWMAIQEALEQIEAPHHILTIHRERIGPAAISSRKLRERAQAAADNLQSGESSVILSINQDGWCLYVEADALPDGVIRPNGEGVSVLKGDVMSWGDRFYRPIRRGIRKKGTRATQLDRPFVVALLIDFPREIIGKSGIVSQALFGGITTILDHNLSSVGESNDRDGVWFDGRQLRMSGVSAVMLQQGLLPSAYLPELHVNPAATRPFVAPVPFRTVQYAMDGDIVQATSQEAEATFAEFFQLPEEWPGPEDRFEGINNENPLPAPGWWSPRDVVSGQ